MTSWSSTNRNEFLDAVTALLARGDKDVRLIHDVFDELYPPPDWPAGPGGPQPAPPDERKLAGTGTRLGKVALVLVAAILAVVVTWPTKTDEPGSRVPGPGVPPLADVLRWPYEPATVIQPDRPAPSLPDPRRVLHLQWPLGLAAAVFLVALGALWRLRISEARDEWRRDHWRRLLDAMPGPHGFEIVPRGLRAPIPRDDLDDVSTVLGRLYAGSPKGQALDVRATIERTLRAGIVSMVLRPRVAPASILVLQDTCPEMGAVGRKVSAFVAGLTTRGVALDCWYFDGDPRAVSRSRHGALVSLEDVARRHSDDTPLLVISRGTRLAAPVSRNLAPGLALLRRWRVRTWVQPVGNRSYWGEALQRAQRSVPIRVWPMTRDGMLAAAYELAVDEDRRIDVRADRLYRRRPTLDEVERLKRLVALLPHASLDLAELLRQRFCPEVPEEVILELLASARDSTGDVLQWPTAERERLLAATRAAPAGSPLGEEAVRRFLRRIIEESEPPKDSAAHLRWRLYRAENQIYLHDERHAEVEQAVAELNALKAGPLWEETTEALGRLGVPGKEHPLGEPALPIAPPVPSRVRREIVLLAREPGGARLPEPTRGGRRAEWLANPLLSPWPTLGDGLRAALLAMLVTLGAWAGFLDVIETLEHMQEAYSAVWRPQLKRLDVKKLKRDAPDTVQVYTDGTSWPGGATTLLESVASLSFDPPHRGAWLRVHARLEDGRLAVSEPVFAPGVASAAVATKIQGQDGAPMVLVAAGEFWMGSDDGDKDEKPRRRVYLDGYYVDKYEVTNAHYKRFLEATRRALPEYWSDKRFNAPDQPVVGVSWGDAQTYCKRWDKRLPTEAEWEKAARGTDGRKYPWVDPWDSSRANSAESKAVAPRPVGSYPTGVSPYGVHDMAGNVWEWVADWFDDGYYKNAPSRNPPGPLSGARRVVRGGSWNDDPILLRAAGRFYLPPDYRGSSLGFRCARGLPRGVES